ncbi:MAG: DUF6528 family protein [Planctomycetaceae bacterium]|jgi:hypothetical protein|nr:DUF6528 family protein [Planctomycetaceae bacterium]
MKMLKLLLKSVIFCTVLCFLSQSVCYSNDSDQSGLDGIVVCGGDKVYIIDEKTSDNTNVNIVWQWQVSEAQSQLPNDYRKLIALDECKPVDNGTKLLLTGGNGLLLLERKTKKCLFFAYVPAVHSADLLPDNKIVAALSTVEKGNSIEVYDINQPGKVLFKDTLYSGHGAVWNSERHRFYALGFDELREYSLKNWNTPSPELKLEKSWKIPVEGGHDLFRVSKEELLVSGHEGVCSFNIEQEKFTPFKPLQSVPHVKSVNYIPETGKLLYTKAEESWWTHNIYLENPNKKITLPDLNIYKVRMIKYFEQ